MKIALVIGSLQAGGAERVMSVLANDLAERHAITLVKLTRSMDHYVLAPEVRVVEVVPAGRSALVRATVDKVRIIFTLRHTLRRTRSEVVVSFIDLTNIRTILATRFSPVRTVVSERVDPTVHRIKRSHNVLRRVTYRWADRLVVQTNAVAVWAETLVDPTRVAVLPNPLSFEPFPDSGNSRSQLVLGVGRLMEQKGFDVLIDAFARVAPHHPDWSLRIVGQGPLERVLRRRAEASGVGSRIEFVGLRHNIVDEYREAGVFVLSSRYEGFPNALLEALAAGTPSIATDCRSGPAELLGDSAGALLVPVDDVAAMAEALGGLMRDESARRLLGERGLARSHEFTTARVVARWEELIRSVAYET